MRPCVHRHRLTYPCGTHNVQNASDERSTAARPLHGRGATFGDPPRTSRCLQADPRLRPAIRRPERPPGASERTRICFSRTLRKSNPFRSSPDSREKHQEIRGSDPSRFLSWQGEVPRDEKEALRFIDPCFFSTCSLTTYCTGIGHTDPQFGPEVCRMCIRASSDSSFTRWRSEQGIAQAVRLSMGALKRRGGQHPDWLLEAGRITDPRQALRVQILGKSLRTRRHDAAQHVPDPPLR